MAAYSGNDKVKIQLFHQIDKSISMAQEKMISHLGMAAWSWYGEK